MEEGEVTLDINGSVLVIESKEDKGRVGRMSGCLLFPPINQSVSNVAALCGHVRSNESWHLNGPRLDEDAEVSC